MLKIIVEMENKIIFIHYFIIIFQLINIQKTKLKNLKKKSRKFNDKKKVIQFLNERVIYNLFYIKTKL